MDTVEIDAADIEAFQQDLNLEAQTPVDESLLPKLGPSQVIQSFGTKLSEQDWCRNDSKNIEIEHYDKENALDKGFKFMCTKMLACNEELTNEFRHFHGYLKETCTELMANLPEDDPQASLIRNLFAALKAKTINPEDAEEFYYFGRIQFESSGHHFDYTAIFLLIQYGRSTLLQLDLSELAEGDEHSFALFPGQIVLLKAIGRKGVLVVKEIVNLLEVFPLKFADKAPRLLMKQPLSMMCASGPFIARDKAINCSINPYFESLIKHMKLTNPDVLVLFGPFIDSNQLEEVARWTLTRAKQNDSELLSPNFNLEKLQSKHMSGLLKSINSIGLQTKVVFIPSERELDQANIFPTFANTKQFLSRSIEYFTNPSMLDIEGVVVGLTSTDILLHLSRNEKFKNSSAKPRDRLRRLVSYVLERQHFYPLLPPENSVNMEYSKYKYLKMPVSPHLLLLPSLLKPFVYNLNGCVVINPGKMTHNCVTRIRIDPEDNSTPYSGSIAHLISVESIKLDSELSLARD